MELSQEVAWAIFERMVLIRTVEETIASHYGEQQMRCPTHLSSGQEGVPGTLSALLTDYDYAMSTHRGHAHYLGKGGGVDAMIGELYGKENGCAKGFGGSMHLIDTSVGFMGTTAIVGNTIPIGVGLALSIKQKSEERISVVYLGDGAVEEGVFYESVNFAVLHKLPVLFVCENNFYSVYSPLSVRQPQDRAIHRMVEGMGCPSSFGDGNDIFTLYPLLKEAVDAVRAGNGPRFVELETYRHREHCGPFFDDHLNYRPEPQVDHWKSRDPITLCSEALTQRAWCTQDAIAQLKDTTQARVDQAFVTAQQAPYPNVPDLKSLVYRNPIH